MIFSILFGIVCFLLILFLGYLWLGLRQLYAQVEYIHYCLHFLSCTNYGIMGTLNGREMSAEEEFEFIKYQAVIRDEACRLGLDDPFPRPEGN